MACRRDASGATVFFLSHPLLSLSRWLSRVGFSKRSPEIPLPIRSHQEFSVQLMNGGVCDKAHIVYRITLTASRCRRRPQAVSWHPSTSCRSADFQTTCDGLSAPLGCTKGEESEAREGKAHRYQNGRSESVSTTSYVALWLTHLASSGLRPPMLPFNPPDLSKTQGSET